MEGQAAPRAAAEAVKGSEMTQRADGDGAPLVRTLPNLLTIRVDLCAFFWAHRSFGRALQPLCAHGKYFTCTLEVFERVGRVLRESDPDHVDPAWRRKRADDSNHTITNLGRQLPGHERTNAVLRIENELNRRANTELACRTVDMVER